MNRNRHLTFRCTQEEYNLIKAHCGKNLSRFIVSRLFKGMAEDVRPKSDNELKDQARLVILDWASQPDNAKMILTMMAKDKT